MFIPFILLALFLPAASALTQDACTVETLAGAFEGLPPGDGGLAVDAELYFPTDVRLGPDGGFYIADTGQRVVRRVRPDGVMETVVGRGGQGFSGEGGPATEALLVGPTSVAFGPDGNLFLRDGLRILTVADDGVLSTFAGGDEGGVIGSLGETVFGPDGAPYAVAAQRHQVYRVDPDGSATLIAGRGDRGFAGDGGPATEALLDRPTDLAVDSSGAVYILDSGNSRIRLVGTDGVIETYVNGPGFTPSPDGTPRESVQLLFSATQVEIDGQDNLYWQEGSVIRRLPPSGPLETVAELPSQPTRFTVTPNGRLLVIRATQVFEAFADTPPELLAGVGPSGPRGEGGPSRNAFVSSIDGLAANAAGDIFYSDEGLSRVRRIRPDGVIERVAGTGLLESFEQEGIQAIEADVRPEGVALDAAGRVTFIERRRVVRVEADGTLTWIAGSGDTGCPTRDCGDGDPAREAHFPGADLLAADAAGNLYVRHRTRGQEADPWIRRIGPNLDVDTLPAGAIDGWPVEAAHAFAVDPTTGELLVGVGGGVSPSRLVAFSTDNEARTVDGYEGYFGRANALAVHPSGDIYVADNLDYTVKRLDAGGRRHRVAGSGEAGLAGGDGPVDELRFGFISALTVTPDGDLLIADSTNDRLLRIHNVAACPDDPRPQIAVTGLRQGASFAPTVSPGTIFSFFGVGLGPDELATAQLEGGEFPTAIAGTRVLVDGTPAPLIFAASGQVSGIVPWSADPSVDQSDASRASWIVERNGVQSAPFRWFIEETSPGFFTLDSSGSGPAAALNQDGTVNGPDNPAAPGEVIVLFGTGFGPLDPPGDDGVLSAAPFGRVVAPVEVRIAGLDASVLYAGAAPGLVSGAIQVNVRIAEAVEATGAVRVDPSVGGRAAPGVEIWVEQGP